MGFKQRAASGSKYLRFKEGKIVSGDSTHDAFEGEPVDFEIIDDEFNKKPYRKAILYLEDPDNGSLVQLEFNMTSGYGRAFASLCQNIVPGKLIEISGSSEEQPGGTQRTKMFIRQGDKPLKWYVTNENAKAMKRPDPIDVKVGKLIVKDWSKVEEYNEKMCASWRKKLVALTGGLASRKPTAAPTATDTEPMDDLPF